MKIKGALTAIALTLLWIAFDAPAQAAGTITGKEVPIAVGPGDQSDPAISGPIISYTDVSSGTADVYFYDERTKTTHPGATGPGDQEFSSVSGNLIAYTEYAGLAPAEVWTYDITTGVATNISNRPDSDQLKPAISSQLIAWEDKRQGLPHIFVYILSSGVTQQISGGGPQSDPAASGGRVVYTDESTGSQVKVWDLATGTTTVFGALTGQPDIDGENVAYVDMSGANWDVVVHNLTSGAETRLTLPGTGGGYPKISGEFVAFEDWSSGASHIVLWHWTGGELHYFSPLTSIQTLAAISGNRIVYTDNRNGNLDIYAYDFTFTYPPPPPPPPPLVGCANPIGALADYWVVRRVRGLPAIGTAYFSSTVAQNVKVCITGTDVTAGWVVLNLHVDATPADFGPGTVYFERPDFVHKGLNASAAALVGRIGASIHVRIVPAP